MVDLVTSSPIVEPPLVSIIIRTYNGRIEWLKRALLSACEQTYCKIQIVVVEDGSDNVGGLISEVQEKYPERYVLHIPLLKVGRSRAANEGVARASGKYALFLDDDDLLFVNHVELLVSALGENKRCRVAYAAAVCAETKIDTISPLHYSEKRRTVSADREYSKPLLWVKNYIPIQSVLFEASLYEEVGGMATNQDAFEDWGLWLMCSIKTQFLHVPEITSLYRVPYGAGEKVARQVAMESGLERIRQVRQEVLSYMTDKERKVFLEEVKSYSNVLGIPMWKLRSIILRYKILHPIYGLASQFALRLQNRK